MVSIFGFGILLVLVWPSISYFRMKGPPMMVQALYAHMSVALRQYKEEYGVYPEPSDNKTVLAALTGANSKGIVFFEPHPKQMNKNGEILDKWGTPIRISYVSNGPPAFLSAGEDKVFGSSDDIRDKR